MRKDDILVPIVLLLLSITVGCPPRGSGVDSGSTTANQGGVELGPFMRMRQGNSNFQAKLSSSEESNLKQAIQQTTANSTGQKGHIDVNVSNGHLVFTPHYSPKDALQQKGEAGIYSGKSDSSTTTVAVVPSDQAMAEIQKRR